jgi:hypothetical protein
MMEKSEIQQLKDLQYEEFVQKTLTELIILSTNHNILKELIDHSREIGLHDELLDALSTMRDEKILEILKNEQS